MNPRLPLGTAIILFAALFLTGCLLPYAVNAESQDNARVRAIPEFMKWARQNGARLDKRISLEPLEGFGLGLVAHEAIAAGERYLTIDTKLAIGRQTVLKDKQLAPAIAALPMAMQQDVKLLLVLFLLHHKHAQQEGSFWWPYIRILPPGYPQSPIFWQDHRLESLQGSYAFATVVSDRIRLKKKFETLKTGVLDRFPELFPGEAADYQEFLWAQWTINSRLFYIEGLQPREHLVPLADMVNCKEPPEPSTVAFVEIGPADNQVQLRSDRAVAVGEQIFESYGGKSGFETFYFEGFLLEPPADDCVWIDPDSGAGTGPRRYRCLDTTDVKNHVDLQGLRTSVNNGLSKNPFGATGNDSDTLEVRFRRQEKRQLLALLQAIDEESTRRAQGGPQPVDPALPLPSSPNGFSLGGRCSSTDTECLQNKADGINRWAADLGAELKVKVAPVPHMRMGAVATMPISVGDTYVRMPAEAVLDGDDLAPSSLAQLIYQADRRLRNNNEKPLNQQERLRMLLLAEVRKEEKSHFAPYLNALPGDFADSPVTWGKEDLLLLGFSRAGAYAFRQRRAILDEFRRFQQHVVPLEAGFGWVSLEDYAWASLVLLTRCIWWGKQCHLVPVLDMVNCDSGPKANPYPPHSTRFDPTKAAAVTSARGSFKKGQQVFENYGRSNFYYAYQHGFVLDDNPQDTVWVPLGRTLTAIGPSRLPRLLAQTAKKYPDEDPSRVLAEAIMRHLKYMERRLPRPNAKFSRQSSAFKLAIKLYSAQRQSLSETLLQLSQ